MESGFYKFKGKDKSLGYTKGRDYFLSIKNPSWLIRHMFWGEPSWRVIIVAPQPCPYISKDKFLENWDVADEVFGLQRTVVKRKRNTTNSMPVVPKCKYKGGQ